MARVFNYAKGAMPNTCDLHAKRTHSLTRPRPPSGASRQMGTINIRTNNVEAFSARLISWTITYHKIVMNLVSFARQTPIFQHLKHSFSFFNHYPLCGLGDQSIAIALMSVRQKDKLPPRCHRTLCPYLGAAEKRRRPPESIALI